MKKVTSCLGCGQLVRLNNTYKCEAVITHVVLLTGERKSEVVQGRLCARCANIAGYKVRKELLEPVMPRGGEKYGEKKKE